MYRKVFVVYLFLVMDSLDGGIQVTFKMLFFILVSTDYLKNDYFYNFNSKIKNILPL